MKRMMIICGVYVLFFSLNGCSNGEIDPPPIEATFLQLSSYNANEQTRHWRAQGVKLYDEEMQFSQATMMENNELELQATELTVPLYRGEWHGKAVTILQKELSMYGDIFHFDERSGLLNLEEHVEIIQDKMKVYTNKLTYDSRENSLTLESPSGFLS